MKRIFNSSALIFFVAIIISSCSSSKEVESLSAEEQFKLAMKNFEKENYLEAIENFKIVTVQYQGSSYADDAQFYIAESRFLRGEYILAGAEYDMLVRLMPSSSFVPIARYKRALSFYNLSPKSQLDQKYTKLAIDDFQTFIEYSPKDTLVPDAEQKISELTNKLALKIFESGKLYYRMEFYKAAISYFDYVIEIYHDTEFADDAFLWKARSYHERKDDVSALRTLEQLFEKFPASTVADEANELKKEIMNNSHSSFAAPITSSTGS